MVEYCLYKISFKLWVIMLIISSHLTYRLKGKELTEKAVSQAITLSEQKFCGVAATVRGVAEITTSFEILA